MKGGDVVQSVDVETDYQQVQKPIVVVVEEPGGKALIGLRNARLPGDVGELPTLRGVGAIVAEEDAGRTLASDVEVGTAVVVVVAPSYAFDVAQVGKSGFTGDVGKGAVAVVVEQLRRVRVFHARLVAKHQIEKAVVVIVGPGGGLRRVRGQQASRLGDIREGNLTLRVGAVVAEQGAWVVAELAPPRAAQHEI